MEVYVHEEMCGELSNFLTQFMSETLSKTLDSRLRGVVGRVAAAYRTV